MRFSRLRLTGFKSFVDPTDLVIADGLTGVVGPNGCGKSNLLEALRWVMGESRPTAMRGGGMEDVIFAGTATRPARAVAEVAIHVDNAERLAPAEFNDRDHLEIVRRITRDAGSAYRLNGKDSRARDVQMLFADAATGAQSPALVRQGQISELINAKPKARRRVLEDAAGIAGLYQRRHEAELKLRATETNLSRVDDVLEQLAGQLSTLARQARQAARYREIGAQLRRAEGVLLYRRWSEAEAARAAAASDLTDLSVTAARAETAAQQAARTREAAEAALPDLREEAAIAGALHQRLSTEKTALEAERAQADTAIATLEAQIAQLDRDHAREEALNGDAGHSISALESESAELAHAASGHEDALAEAAEAAHAAARALQSAEAALSETTEDTARLAARHQAAQRLAEEARTTLARHREEAARAAEAARTGAARLAEARAEMAAAETEASKATELAALAETTVSETETARAEAQTGETAARAARAEAEGAAATLQAETAALQKLVARGRSDATPVLDRVRVASGYERALGAALGDDLSAPDSDGAGSGWRHLPDYDAAPDLPAGAGPLAAHVTAPPVLARRLRRIGVVDRDAAARLQAGLAPGQRLVTPQGDLYRWDGLIVAADDAVGAAARRLEQVNRLAALHAEMSRAQARAAEAAAGHDAEARRLAQLAEAEREAREARRRADRQMADASRDLSRLEAECEMLSGKLDALTLSQSRHEAEAASAEARAAEAATTLAGLEDLHAARARADTAQDAVEAARGRMLAARAAHDGLRRDGEARARRQAAIAEDLATWRTRLASAGARLDQLARRRAAAATELATARARPGEIAARIERLEAELSRADDRRRRADDALREGEATERAATTAERSAERDAGAAREARAAGAARAESAETAAREAAARIHEALDMAPAELPDRLGIDPGQLAEADRIEADVTRLRRQRDALGAVNLRAEEDARAVEAEHAALAGEKADLDAAIGKLRAGIAALNREGRERLLTAFDEVNRNFAGLFRHLFGGGEANLVLVESDDPLEAGLEIMCQPPGKKLATMSLLSGGEQTLTALALIFAVFRANPAPICVLDEVDAPLDDANVARFCDLLDEMTRATDTRFLIITHHAVTMSRMDRLFGVTMAEQGVSQLVSVDLGRAEAMVA